MLWHITSLFIYFKTKALKPSTVNLIKFDISNLASLTMFGLNHILENTEQKLVVLKIIKFYTSVKKSVKTEKG